MLTFLKLGGSLLTDKRVQAEFRLETARRIAAEITAALQADPNLQLLIGHGSGSFGHFAANRYQTAKGVHTPEQWRGFAEVATVAAELNYLVAQALHSAGVPVWRIQPSASAISHDGRLKHMALEPIRAALEHRLVPLVYGDVALDEVRGGTIISTETIFFYLAQHLPVERILLFGETEGVYDSSGAIIPEITTANFDQIAAALGGSEGVDVTGGMATKVRDMLELVTQIAQQRDKPRVEIRIADGTQPNLLQNILLGQSAPGTAIR